MQDRHWQIVTDQGAPIWENLNLPLRWRGAYRAILVGDLFHPDVPYDYIARVFAVMAMTPQHTYQVLTKRPERMQEIVSQLYDKDALDIRVSVVGNWWDGVPRNKITTDHVSTPLSNVWLGTSVENQKTADERIPYLLRVPAVVRFLSAEPLLGPIDLQHITIEHNYLVDALTGQEESAFGPPENWGKITWAITGGESGPHARPFNLWWAQDLVEQCQRSGVACFVKQLGSFPVVNYYADDDLREWALERPHTILRPTHRGLVEYNTRHEGQPPPGALLSVKLGKRKGGNIDEFPDVLKVREFPDALGRGVEVTHG